uniref:Uncharacterized protein n=1 Tax=Glycine max TaxID=3847 RepID=C6T1L2_SOYBN|nr:unknown [Glycine max]
MYMNLKNANPLLSDEPSKMNLMSSFPTVIFLILKLIFFFNVHFCITFVIFSILFKE